MIEGCSQPRSSVINCGDKYTVFLSRMAVAVVVRLVIRLPEIEIKSI